MTNPYFVSRRSVLAGSLAGGALAVMPPWWPAARATFPAILKPTPSDLFVDFGTAITPRLQ
jgi:hypothetical protein